MGSPRVLFIEITNSLYDRHSIYTLSAVLNQVNVKSDYLASNNLKIILKELERQSPDLVLYSTFSSHVPDYIHLDRAIKSYHPKLVSLIGGPGVTNHRSQLLIKSSTIDGVCIGEGENSIRDFIMNGFSFGRNLVARNDLGKSVDFYPYVNLDKEPFPDRSVVYLKDTLLRDMPSKQFLAGRGCPYSCTYCQNHLTNATFKSCGNVVRLKSVDYLLEEIALVKARYPLRTVVFQDDTFFIDKKWGFEFSEKYSRKIGLPFSCNLRSNVVNEDVVKALKEAGCVSVAWSIESGDEGLRNSVLNRGVSDEQILTMSSLLNRYSIRHRINNILGIPGETFEQMLKTLELNIKAKPFSSLAYTFIPYPDLKLTQYAIEKGYFNLENADKLSAHFLKDSMLSYSEKEKKKIRNLMYLFPLLVKIPTLYFNHLLFATLMRVPSLLLYVINRVTTLYLMSQQFRVETGWRTKLRLAFRFISYGT